MSKLQVLASAKQGRERRPAFWLLAAAAASGVAAGDAAESKAPPTFEQGLRRSIAIQGQDIASHARLRRGVYPDAILPPEQGGGRFLDESDRGQPHAVISAKVESPAYIGRR